MCSMKAELCQDVRSEIRDKAAGGDGECRVSVMAREGLSEEVISEWESA